MSSSSSEFPVYRNLFGSRDLFRRFLYDQSTMSFVDVDTEAIKIAESGLPPDNCPVCMLQGELKQQSQPLIIGDNEGVAYKGQNYHIYDFVLYQGKDGPACIGHIVNIRLPPKDDSFPFFVVQRVGRIGDLKDILPVDVVIDEVCGSLVLSLSCQPYSNMIPSNISF